MSANVLKGLIGIESAKGKTVSLKYKDQANWTEFKYSFITRDEKPKKQTFSA